MTHEFGSQAAYARHREVSKQTVTDWKIKGLVVFNEDGKVDFDGTDVALKDHGIRQVVDENARLVAADGAELWSKADAEKVKENYAARLKQLEYDREAALVVEIDDVIVAVASEYSVVRNRLRRIGEDVAPKLVSTTSAEVAKSVIDRAVVAALEDVSIT